MWRSIGVSIDGEMFLGPVLASLPSAHHAGALPAALIVVMVSLAVTLLLQTRAAGAVSRRDSALRWHYPCSLREEGWICGHAGSG